MFHCYCDVSCNGNDVMKSFAANPKLCGCFWARGTAEFRVLDVIHPKVVFAEFKITGQVSMKITAIPLIDTDVEIVCILFIISMRRAISALVPPDVDKLVLATATTNFWHRSNDIEVFK